MSFFWDTLLFFYGLFVLIALPGWSTMRIFGLHRLRLDSWTKKVILLGLGLVTLDFLLFLYSKIHCPISASSLYLGIGLWVLVGLILGKKIKALPSEPGISENTLFQFFSWKKLFILILLIFAAVFIKVFYLSGSLAPTATDLGHHMYWSKWMAENHQLPTYDGMPDFIIGEHTLFGSLNLLTGLDFFGPFPIALLLTINLLSLLVIVLIAQKIWHNDYVTILTVFFSGVLFAVTSPQAKFVSGGVVGNLLGNFLMPLAFLCFLEAWDHIQSSSTIETLKSKRLMAVGLAITFGLFYTHHLTAFIFLFVSVLTFVLYLATQRKNFLFSLKRIGSIILSKEVLTVFFIGLIFFFWVFTPTYVQTQAVGSAVGAPSKNTRAGLDFIDLIRSIGEARLILGFSGLIFLFFSWKKESLGHALIASWMIMIYIMSSFPRLLLINLPSDRIGNYLSYPAALLSAFAISYLFETYSSKNFVKMAWILSATILIWATSEGIADSITSLRNPIATNNLAQTFEASNYLSGHLSQKDFVLKDHNYLTGDTWIKLFFMRGYNYPLSRSLFKRYEDETKPREMCTLKMISVPESPEAKECFNQTGVNLLMVNPQFDAAQFKRSYDFNAVYMSPQIAIFYRY